MSPRFKARIRPPKSNHKNQSHCPRYLRYQFTTHQSNFQIIYSKEDRIHARAEIILQEYQRNKNARPVQSKSASPVPSSEFFRSKNWAEKRSLSHRFQQKSISTDHLVSQKNKTTTSFHVNNYLVTFHSFKRKTKLRLLLQFFSQKDFKDVKFSQEIEKSEMTSGKLQNCGFFHEN